MVTIDMLVLGGTNSGKGHFINRFINEAYGSSQKDNSGLFYFVARKKQTRYSIWSITGHQTKKLVPGLMPKLQHPQNLCIYTLDLSAPFNKELMDEHIALIRAKNNPTLPVILVGCKSDEQRQINDENFANIQKEFGIKYAVVTSAKTGEGLEQFTALLDYALVADKAEKKVSLPSNDPPEENTVIAHNEEVIRQTRINTITLDQIKLLLRKNGPLYKAIENLEDLIKYLPPQQEELIKKAIIKLVADLHANTPPDQAINEFVQSCDNALAQLSNMDIAKDIFRRVRTGVLIVAVIAGATALAATFIFGSSFLVAGLIFGGLTLTVGGALIAKAKFFPPVPAGLKKLSIEAANVEANLAPPTEIQCS